MLINWTGPILVTFTGEYAHMTKQIGSSRLLVLTVCAVFGWLFLGSVEQGRAGIETAQAAHGCGPGYRLDVYGNCRPRYYGAVPYGGAYYGGRYGYGYRG